MNVKSKSSGFYTLTIVILALAAVVTFGLAVKMTFMAPGSEEGNTEADIAARIRPFGSVRLPGHELEDEALQVPEHEPVAPVATTMTGPQVYNEACIICHGSGIGGAPVVPDPAGWVDRIAQGNDTLYDHAINGFTGAAGFMPEKGGRLDLSDEEVRLAVDYMVNESQ